MLSQITLIFILTAVAIQAMQLDRGPQTFTNTNDSSAGTAQNQQKRFADKGIIVYLTPDQIKDLQAGKMELRSHSSGEISISRRRQMTQKNSQLRYNSHRDNLNILKAPLVHKSQLVDVEQEQQGERNFNAPNGLSLNRGGLTPQLLLFSQENQRPEVQPSEQNQQNNQNELTPRNPVKQENSEEQYLQEQIKKYFQNSFENNNYQQGKPVSNAQNNQPESGNEKAPNQQQIPNYNSFLNALVRGNVLREQNNVTENQKSLGQEEAFGNLSPVIIQKEVHITQHKHVPVVKHVNVPVPTPVLVPILHPYEVRVPQPYPVPVEVIKRIPVQERNPERNAEINSQRNAERNAERNLERNAVRNSERNAERNVERNSERNAVRNSERNAERNVERNSERNAVRNSERNTEQNADRNTEQNAVRISGRAEAENVPIELRQHHHGKNVYINVDSPAYLQLWKHK